MSSLNFKIFKLSPDSFIYWADTVFWRLLSEVLLRCIKLMRECERRLSGLLQANYTTAIRRLERSD